MVAAAAAAVEVVVEAYRLNLLVVHHTQHLQSHFQTFVQVQEELEIIEAIAAAAVVVVVASNIARWNAALARAAVSCLLLASLLHF